MRTTLYICVLFALLVSLSTMGCKQKEEEPTGQAAGAIEEAATSPQSEQGLEEAGSAAK